MDYTEDFDAQFAWLTTKIECGCVKLSSTNRMILRAKILTMLLEIIPDEMHIDDVKKIANSGFDAIENAWSKWKRERGF